jgi:hypothetical protein
MVFIYLVTIFMLSSACFGMEVEKGTFCKKLSGKTATELQQCLPLVHESVNEYITVAQSEYIVPVELHEKVIAYVYALSFWNKSIKELYEKMPINSGTKIEGTRYSFNNATVYVVLDKIKSAFKIYKPLKHEFCRSYYSPLCTYGDFHELYHNNIVEHGQYRMGWGTTRRSPMELGIARVQCNGDICLSYTKNDGTQWSIVDGECKSGNVTQHEAIVQEEKNFSAKWKNGITCIWDNKKKEVVGNVNYPFGRPQDVSVLFCSSVGAILYYSPMNLMFDFTGDGSMSREISYRLV